MHSVVCLLQCDCDLVVLFFLLYSWRERRLERERLSRPCRRRGDGTAWWGERNWPPSSASPRTSPPGTKGGTFHSSSSPSRGATVSPSPIPPTLHDASSTTQTWSVNTSCQITIGDSTNFFTSHTHVGMRPPYPPMHGPPPPGGGGNRFPHGPPPMPYRPRYPPHYNPYDMAM